MTQMMELHRSGVYTFSVPHVDMELSGDTRVEVTDYLGTWCGCFYVDDEDIFDADYFAAQCDAWITVTENPECDR